MANLQQRPEQCLLQLLPPAALRAPKWPLSLATLSQPGGLLQISSPHVPRLMLNVSIKGGSRLLSHAGKIEFAISVVRIQISYFKKPSWCFCRDTEMKTATAGQGLPWITHRCGLELQPVLILKNVVERIKNFGEVCVGIKSQTKSCQCETGCSSSINIKKKSVYTICEIKVWNSWCLFPTWLPFHHERNRPVQLPFTFPVVSNRPFYTVKLFWLRLQHIFPIMQKMLCKQLFPLHK